MSEDSASKSDDEINIELSAVKQSVEVTNVVLSANASLFKVTVGKGEVELVVIKASVNRYP